MTDHNMTDKEQMEMIKRWWKSYGRSIAIAVAIGLAIGFGWKYWHQHQQQKAEQASVLYQSMSISDYEKKPQLAKKFAKALMKDYQHSPYAAFAALWSAKVAVQNNQLADALQYCQWVLKNSQVNSIKQIARIRAARILIAQKKAKDALSLLNKVNDKVFMPMINTVKGDAYTALGRSDAARKAYEAAKTGMSAANATNPLLNMKLAQ